MSEPIEEIKRRIIKQEIQKDEAENTETEKEIGEFKGHKFEHIDPKSSRTRDLFKKNIVDMQDKKE